MFVKRLLYKYKTKTKICFYLHKLVHEILEEANLVKRVIHFSTENQ